MRTRSTARWLVAGIILLAGLWPGEAPRENRVAWHAEGPGLRFAAPSQSVGEGPLWIDTGAVTLELWLDSQAPAQAGNREILALLDGPRVHRLLVGQFREGLIFRGRLDNPAGDPKRDRYADLSPHGGFHHVAVTTGRHGAALFANGATTGLELPATRTVPGAPFGGRLLLGTSDDNWAEWRGSVFALAIHRRILSPSEISQHAELRFHRDSKDAVDRIMESPELFALYLFDEGGDARIESLLPGAPALLLPRQLTRPLQTTIFSGLAHQRWLPFDVALNILGFVPFGFLVASGSAQRSRSGRVATRGVWLAFSYGVALSLAIELAQLWIPGRDSSLLDWIGNSVGALLGGLVAAGTQRLRRSALPQHDPLGSE